jgi:drug/metabolite transporter (DMT)-like permease
MAGILIASFGMILMTLPSASLHELSAISRGDFLSILCAATFALHIVVISHFSPLRGFEPIAVTQITTAAILGVAFFRIAEPFRLHMTPGLAAAVLITGLFATALAFTAQAWAQQYTPANRAAVIFALEPVVAWLTSYLLTGETMTRVGMAGAVLILAGILLVELKRSQGEEHHKRGVASFDV